MFQRWRKAGLRLWRWARRSEADRVSLSTVKRLGRASRCEFSESVRLPLTNLERQAQNSDAAREAIPSLRAKRGSPGARIRSLG